MWWPPTICCTASIRPLTPAKPSFMSLRSEAATLRRFTLARRRWKTVGIVVGDDAESAERRFFDEWMDEHGVDGAWSPPAPPASSPPVLDGTLSRRPAAASEVVGLFPEPGASR